MNFEASLDNASHRLAENPTGSATIRLARRCEVVRISRNKTEVRVKTGPFQEQYFHSRKLYMYLYSSSDGPMTLNANFSGQVLIYIFAVYLGRYSVPQYS